LPDAVGVLSDPPGPDPVSPVVPKPVEAAADDELDPEIVDVESVDSEVVVPIRSELLL